MYKPSYDDLDAIARKNGWYTRDNHPPFPFLAIVSDDDDELKSCNDQAEYKEGDITGRRIVRLVFRINDEFLYPGKKSSLGPFGHNFARPYKGPVNGVELNTIHVDMSPVEVPALVEHDSPAGIKSFIRGLLR